MRAGRSSSMESEFKITDGATPIDTNGSARKSNTAPRVYTGLISLVPSRPGDVIVSVPIGDTFRSAPYHSRASHGGSVAACACAGRGARIATGPRTTSMVRALMWRLDAKHARCQRRPRDLRNDFIALAFPASAPLHARSPHHDSGAIACRGE